jgi:hypothetical protein
VSSSTVLDAELLLWLRAAPRPLGSLFGSFSPRGARSKGDQQPNGRVAHNQKLQNIFGVDTGILATRVLRVRNGGAPSQVCQTRPLVKPGPTLHAGMRFQMPKLAPLFQQKTMPIILCLIMPSPISQAGSLLADSPLVQTPPSCRAIF